MRYGDASEELPTDGSSVEFGGAVEFRPSWESYRSKMFKVPAFLLVILAINLPRMRDPAMLAVVGATVAFSIGGVALYFRKAVVRVGPDGFTRRSLLRTRHVPEERLGHVILAPEVSHFDERVDTTLIVTDADGRRVAMFNGPFWSEQELAEMAWALQRPTWRPFGPITFREIRERYPRAVPLRYARPMVFAWVVVAVIFGAGAVIGSIAYLLVSMFG